MTALKAELPYVTAPVNYAGPMKGNARVDIFDPETQNLVLTSETVTIRDGRPIRDTFDLDQHGFACVDHTCKALEGRTVAEIGLEQEDLEAAYHQEVGDALSRVTGADVVLPHRFGFTFRASEELSTRDGAPQETGVPSADKAVSKRTGLPLVYQPALMAHADYTEKSFHEHVAFIHKREGVPLKSYRRGAMCHVWRAISRPPQDKPLAVTDGRSVRKDGYVTLDAIIGPQDIDGNVFQSRIVRPDPAIDWYYFSNMTASEILIFKGFDTQMDSASGVYHTAFHDPSPGGKSPRASLEARYFIFWE